jgi:hypothetical protein
MCGIPTVTKAKARVSNRPNSLSELKKQLEARTRELAEVRGHLSEALEQQGLRLRLAAGAGREAGRRLIASAELDGVHGNQDSRASERKGSTPHETAALRADRVDYGSATKTGI